MSPLQTTRLPLPLALAVALWAAAHARGQCTADEAARRALGEGHRHVEQVGQDIAAWIAETGELPGTSVRPALPRPGRIQGLIGPPAAITAALEAGQAVIVSALGLAEHTLVPRVEVIGSEGAQGVVVRWERLRAPFGAAAVDPPMGAARSELLAALRRAAGSSERLDLVPDEPVALDRLPADWTGTDLPRDADPADAHLLELSARTLMLVEAELDAEGGIGPHGSGQREAILADLAEAARAALVEAVTRASRRD